MAGYRVRAFLVAQSLHQIDRAYGGNHSILDNCHVRVVFAANDERSAKRFSEALGTATELRAQRNLSGRRLAPWLSHTSLSEQETGRPLLTPGEILQLSPDDELVLVAGHPPVRAKKLRYFEDHNFLSRLHAPPRLAAAHDGNAPRGRTHGWSGFVRGAHPELEKRWSALIAAESRRAGELEPDADPAGDRSGAGPIDRDAANADLSARERTPDYDIVDPTLRGVIEDDSVPA